MPGRAQEMTSRWASAQPLAHIEMPTQQIPPDCFCSWIVVRPGAGMECISRLKFRNAICGYRHRLQPVPATGGR